VSYEQLSQWVAEIGYDGFNGFVAAHSWTTRGAGGSPFAALRMLSALGYIEVDWRARRWGAVPPCLTLLPDAAGHGLLVGARTGRLTREIAEGVTAQDAELMPVPQLKAPDALYVAADSAKALAAVAASLDVPYVHSVVERLGGVLPYLDAELVDHLTPPIVRHYGVERYDLDNGWEPVLRDDVPGLYLYERSGPRAIHFVAPHGDRFDVDLAVGTWAEARRLGIDDFLWWRPDGVNGTLDVPINLPLPSLPDRAATLCSGLSACVSDGSTLYSNVPEWLAQGIAQALSQNLVTVA
jgi:hypothetical protein